MGKWDCIENYPQPGVSQDPLLLGGKRRGTKCQGAAYAAAAIKCRRFPRSCETPGCSGILTDGTGDWLTRSPDSPYYDSQDRRT